MFHEMPLKLYFMKCSERKVSQYILPLKNEEHSQNERIYKTQATKISYDN